MEELSQYTPEETKLLIPIHEQEVAMHLIRAAHRLLTKTKRDIKAEKKNEGFDPETRRWVFYYWAGYAGGVAFRTSGSTPLKDLIGIAKHSVDKDRQSVSEYARGFEDGFNCLMDISSATYGPADDFWNGDIEAEIEKIIKQE
jgi:hypothetical protein